MLQEISSGWNFWTVTEARQSAKGNACPASEGFYLDSLTVSDSITSNCLMMHLSGKRTLENGVDSFSFNFVACIKLLSVETLVFSENEGTAPGEKVGLPELTRLSALVAEGRVQRPWSCVGTVIIIGTCGCSRTNSRLFLIIGLLLPYLLKSPSFLPFGYCNCRGITCCYH